MLAVQLKPEDEILPRISRKKLFVFECSGCQEVYFPRKDVEGFIGKLRGQVVERVILDYLCNRDFVREYIKAYSKKIEESEAVLVFSCGVGVQVVSSLLELSILVVIPFTSMDFRDLAFGNLTVSNAVSVT